jgi:hypothetical protein
MRAHIIDMAVPDSLWRGYWCPKSKKFHRDGIQILMNSHCLICRAMLVRKYPAKGNKKAFTVKG